ncbi:MULTISPECIES: ABC transporter permease [unclassified Mesorhizobium]|uniref:ABC transporter permease n=1 Tax=unclassified Mesorhizobium TaxID=325217 RepID=UPI000965A68C|nr:MULTISPECIES: ABC transporter permease [unclassified Mesorhizobium]MBN9253640.1 ABC transporter permease [Mesorhizobium sp.]OJX81952.1 MAG: ABC transporter permease [Mesorhizobium sp. 65-26]
MAIRIQRVPSESLAGGVAARLVAIVLALVVAAIVFAFTGADLGKLGSHVLKSTFGSRFGLMDLGLIMTPLTLTGLAVMIALKVGAWNIGAEGQFCAGAFAATAVALFVPGPNVVVLPLMFVAGALGGMIWILIPTLARAYADVSELITTLLLNFVGVLLIYYVATGPWLDPSGVSFASTARLPHDVPSFWGDVHWGLPLAILLTIAVAAVLNFTRWGYEVRIAGSNPNAARYAAIPFRRHLIVVMLMSGAIAGLAGMLEAAGTAHRLQGGISNNFGYIGIMVAVLARGSAIGVIAGAALMAIILKSGISLQTQGVNISTVLAITGLILFFTALADELSHYRIVRTKEA